MVINDGNATDIDDRTITLPMADEQTGWVPDPSSVSSGTKAEIRVDTAGNVQTRGQVLTDELSFRSDFTGTVLSDEWAQATNGTGASIGVANSFLTLQSGANSGNYSLISREIDYGPMSIRTKLSAFPRVANQEVYFGMMKEKDITLSPICHVGAYVLFDGVNPDIIKFITRSANDSYNEEITIIALPKPSNIAQILQIDVSSTQCSLAIAGLTVASHFAHIPKPYDTLELVMAIRNTGASSNTSLISDMVAVNNYDKVDIGTQGFTNPIAVTVTENTTEGKSGIADGNVTTSATTEVPINKTTYVEQTSNGQRSFASSSASDSSAGVGIQTLTLKYYNSLLQGPFYELIVLNGTTSVNSINTDICFVESMIGETAGSTGFAVGTISIYAAINKGGAVIGTIAIGDVKTFWARHYVPAGKTMFITNFRCGTSGTVAGNGGVFYIAAKDMLLANSIWKKINDPVVLPGSVPEQNYLYGTSIKVVGPSRVLAFVKPTGTATYISYCGFGFYEV